MNRERVGCGGMSSPVLWTRAGERGAGEVWGRRRGLSLARQCKHAHSWGGREPAAGGEDQVQGFVAEGWEASGMGRG